MALGPFPSCPVTTAQAAHRRVAAEKEGVERRGGGNRKLAPLRARADFPDRLDVSFLWVALWPLRVL